MADWPDTRLRDLLGVPLPIIQAPMAGATTTAMVVAVCEAGGLGSLPCALYGPAEARSAVAEIRSGTARPINLNFFCHAPPAPDAARDRAWLARLAPYFTEMGLDPTAPLPSSGRAPFDADFCDLVEACRPEVVSFHFGLPDAALLARVKRSGARVLGSATSVAEAVFLERHGCDAVIAMGAEAGGHRGNFLSHDMATQAGTFALVPQIVDAVQVPVIAAGGIADGRGIAAAFMLGAAGVQIGTAYLFSPEANIAAVHRQALETARDDSTVLTNVFTGRAARGIANRLVREVGPLSDLAPAFPRAGTAIAALRRKTEPEGSADFVNLWSGQAAALARPMPAAALTRHLAQSALALLRPAR